METVELTDTLLKEKLTDAMVYRGTVRTVLEECKVPGYYQVDAVTPVSELSPLGTVLPALSRLRVEKRGTLDFIQYLIRLDSEVPEGYIRICRQGTWRPWYKMATPTKVI